MLVSGDLGTRLSPAMATSVASQCISQHRSGDGSNHSCYVSHMHATAGGHAEQMSTPSQRTYIKVASFAASYDLPVHIISSAHMQRGVDVPGTSHHGQPSLLQLSWIHVPGEEGGTSLTAAGMNTSSNSCWVSQRDRCALTWCVSGPWCRDGILMS